MMNICVNLEECLAESLELAHILFDEEMTKILDLPLIADVTEIRIVNSWFGEHHIQQLAKNAKRLKTLIIECDDFYTTLENFHPLMGQAFLDVVATMENLTKLVLSPRFSCQKGYSLDCSRLIHLEHFALGCWNQSIELVNVSFMRKLESFTMEYNKAIGYLEQVTSLYWLKRLQVKLFELVLVDEKATLKGFLDMHSLELLTWQKLSAKDLRVGFEKLMMQDKVEIPESDFQGAWLRVGDDFIFQGQLIKKRLS